MATNIVVFVESAGLKDKAQYLPIKMKGVMYRDPFQIRDSS